MSHPHDIQELLIGTAARPMVSLNESMAQKVEALIGLIEPHSYSQSPPPSQMHASPGFFPAPSSPEASSSSSWYHGFREASTSLPRIKVQSPSLPRLSHIPTSAISAVIPSSSSSSSPSPQEAVIEPTPVDVIPFTTINSSSFTHSSSGASVTLAVEKENTNSEKSEKIEKKDTFFTSSVEEAVPETTPEETKELGAGVSGRVDGWYKRRLHQERELWRVKRVELAEGYDRVCTEKVAVQEALWEAERRCDAVGKQLRESLLATAQAETLQGEVTALLSENAKLRAQEEATRTAMHTMQAEHQQQLQEVTEDQTKQEELSARLRAQEVDFRKASLLQEQRVLEEAQRADAAVSEVREGHRFCESLETQLTAATTTCTQLQQELSEVRSQLSDTEHRLSLQTSEFASLKAQRADAAASLDAAERNHSATVQEHLASHNAAVRKAALQHSNTVNTLEAEVARLKTQLETSSASAMQSEMRAVSAVQEQFALFKMQSSTKTAETEKRAKTDLQRLKNAHEAELQIMDEKLRLYSDKTLDSGSFIDRYFHERSERIKLHNTLVQLRGNIRVKARLRAAPISSPLSLKNSGIQMALKNGKAREFRFDGVIPSGCSQEDVFEENAADLVQSVVDGYNVCIMAYGQTGSGKTYTMFGEEGSQEGVVPRAIRHFWEILSASSHTTQKVTVSMLEIYCGDIRDLLTANTTTTTSYKMGSDTVTHSLIEASSAEECIGLVASGLAERSAAATLCNTHSSRSHCVYTLHYEGREEAEGKEVVVTSKMVLVDLGGSECVTKSGVEGQHMREAQAINKSLSALSDVLLALSAARPHIPYRNSKLTHLLAPCLGGDAKMLLFVTVSPEEICASETLHTLDFGHKARQIKRNPAVKHTKVIPANPSLPEAP